MEYDKTLLTMDLSIKIEELSDPQEWSFRIRELGFTLYADTKEEGPEMIGRAIGTLLNSFGDNSPALFRYLDNHGVLYRVEQQSVLQEQQEIIEKESWAKIFFEEASPLAFGGLPEPTWGEGIFRLKEAQVGVAA